MNDPTSALLEAYEGVSKEIPVAEEELRTSPVEEYRAMARSKFLRAAAVLHHFALGTLKPVDELSPFVFDDQEINFDPTVLLFDDCSRVSGSGGDDLYTLKLDARRGTLAELATHQEMLRALESNPDRIQTDLQVTWEEYLRSGAVPLDPLRSTYAELLRLFQIACWLEGIDGQFPDKNYLSDLAKKRSVFASFEHLVTPSFTGREAEIRAIREFIGLVSKSSSLIPNIREGIDRLLGGKPVQSAVLSIHGPGGIGKSALIGKVLSDTSGSDERIPFAYLAFDQPTLRVEDPFTILVEAARQLELQFPEQPAIFAWFKDMVRDFRNLRGSYQQRISSSATRKERIVNIQSADGMLSTSFGELLERIGHEVFPQRRNLPALLVLDTFEEVQYRDSESLLSFWRTLDLVRMVYPEFRVIICGRASIAETDVGSLAYSELELGGLELDARVRLLIALGVGNATLAQGIASQVGGNPLSLRLAADVVKNDLDSITEGGISDLQTQKFYLFQIDEKVIQGQLYRRILGHIHSEDVRKLAHPGMILRRVDRDVILKLLVPFCNIQIDHPSEADALFEELKREHALVRQGDDGSLEYRPEVRLAVLRLLEQDQQIDVRRLHEAAVRYYENLSSDTARAEEIYHRLVLDEEPYILSERWQSGIEQSIARSIDEFPDRAKAWLASWISLEVPRSVFENSDTSEWERNTTRKVQRSLSEGAAEGALTLLGERPDRTINSPLFALEAKAYMLLENYEQARRVLLSGIDQVSSSTNRGRLAELFWLIAQVEIIADEYETGDRYLKKAELALANAKNPIPLMHVLCHRILIRKTLQYDLNSEPQADLTKRLADVALRLSESDVGSASFVLFFSTRYLEKKEPSAARKLEGFVGLAPDREFSADLLTSDNLKGLEQYREPWENLDGGEESLV